MTGKNGFIVGLVIGLAAWAISVHEVMWSGESKYLPNQVYFFAQVISLISWGAIVFGYLRMKSLVNPTFVGLVAGFTMGFELPTLIHGRLPPP